MFKRITQWVSYFCAVLFLLSFFSFLLLSNESIKNTIHTHWEESFNTLSEVGARLNSSDPTTISGTVDNDGKQYDKKGRELFFMCKDRLCTVTYNFAAPVNLKKLTILLTGYPLYDQEDILFRINGHYLDKNDTYVSCVERGNLCSFYLKTPYKTKALDVFVRNATFKPYGISEIKFFEGAKKGVIDSIFDFLFVFPRTMLAYALYPMLFLLSFLLPGLLLGEILANFKKKIHFLTLLMISTLFLIFTSILTFFLPALFFKLLFSGGLMVLVMLVLKRKSFVRKILSENSLILLITLFSILYMSLFMFIKDNPANQQTNNVYDFYDQSVTEVMVPFGTYEVDFLIPYQSAVNFVRGGSALQEKIGTIYHITDRTPLQSLFIIAYGKLFGMNIFTYQMFIVVSCSLFIIALFYLSHNFVNAEKSYLISTMVMFSHFFIFITFYGPAKTATLLFLLLSYYYLLKKEPDLLLGGMAMALAYFSHPVALVYFMVIVLYLLIHYLKRGKIISTLVQITLFCGPTIILYILWSYFSQSLNQHNNVFWSLMTKPTWQEAAQNISETQHPSTSILSRILIKNFWRDKLYNLTGLLIFYTPKEYLKTIRIRDFFRTTVPGSIGLVGSFLLLRSLVLLFFKKHQSEFFERFKKEIIPFFVILPILLVILYVGYYERAGLMEFVIAIIPFLFILIAHQTSLRHFYWLVFLFISESFYLFVINDTTALSRFVLFFGSSKFYLWFLYGIVLFFSSIIFKLIKARTNT